MKILFLATKKTEITCKSLFVCNINKSKIWKLFLKIRKLNKCCCKKHKSKSFKNNFNFYSNGILLLSCCCKKFVAICCCCLCCCCMFFPFWENRISHGWPTFLANFTWKSVMACSCFWLALVSICLA